MEEVYEVEGRRAATPRVGNEPVAVGGVDPDRPGALVCRGCSYWVTGVGGAGEGARCSECGLAVEASLGEDWIGRAEQEKVEGVQACGRWVGLGLIIALGLLLMIVALGVMRGPEEAAMLIALGMVGSGFVYLGAQARAQMWMMRIDSRGGGWMIVSLVGAFGAAVWLLFFAGIAVSGLAGPSTSGTTVDAFEFVSKWIGLPGAMVLLVAGGIGTWRWARALGDDQVVARRLALAYGVGGGGGLAGMIAALVAMEWAMPRRVWTGGGDPFITTVLQYSAWVAGVGSIAGGVGLVLSGVVWLTVSRRCGWVLKVRGKGEGQ